MSTKLKFAQQLQGILYPKPTIDAKFDEQTAMLAVSQARDEYVKNMIFSLKQETNIVYGNWVSSYDNVPIEYFETRDEYFSYLPVNVISLDSDRGVQRVFNPKSREDEYIIVPRGWNSMMRGSLAKDLEGDRGCFLKQNKVVYLQKEDTNCEMSMDLVVSSEDIDPYEEFPVDSSATLQILTRAAELYRAQKGIPEDVLNNGKSE